ncbi:MAG: hypothetical protein KDD43_12830 [Bdellovibrionales bacterium]|nr:hypothetical protein [Bdellovibrionales bacterium]
MIPALDVPFLFTVHEDGQVTYHVSVSNMSNRVQQVASRKIDIPPEIFGNLNFSGRITNIWFVYILTTSMGTKHIYGKEKRDGEYNNVDGANKKTEILKHFNDTPQNSIIYLDRYAGVVRLYYLGDDHMTVKLAGKEIPLINTSSVDREDNVPQDVGDALFSRSWYEFFFGSSIWEGNLAPRNIQSVRITMQGGRLESAWAELVNGDRVAPKDHGNPLRPYIDGKGFPDGVYHVKRNSDGTYTSDFIRPFGQKLGGMALALALVGLLVVGAGRLKF